MSLKCDPKEEEFSAQFWESSSSSFSHRNFTFTFETSVVVLYPKLNHLSSPPFNTDTFVCPWSYNILKLQMFNCVSSVILFVSMHHKREAFLTNEELPDIG